MPGSRSLSNRAASHASWARTADRSKRTANARAASPAGMDYWLAKLDAEVFANATDRERMAAAASMRKAHFATLAAKSVKARQKAKGARQSG